MDWSLTQLAKFCDGETPTAPDSLMIRHTPHDRLTGSRRGRVAKAAVGVALLYCNLAVIVSPAALRPNGWPAPPLPRAAFDLFLLPGMFSGYSPLNADMRIEVKVRGDGYQTLPLKDYFPDRLGVTYTQFTAARHGDMLGEAARKRAIATRAQRIVGRYRRAHPEHKVEGLRLSIERWPKDPRGYRAQKRAPLVQREVQWEDPSR